MNTRLLAEVQTVALVLVIPAVILWTFMRDPTLSVTRAAVTHHYEQCPVCQESGYTVEELIHADMGYPCVWAKDRPASTD